MPPSRATSVAAWAWRGNSTVRRAISNFLHGVHDTLECKRMRWHSQLRGRARARLCLADEAWLAAFRGDGAPRFADYAQLFRYFLAGFVTYRSPLGAHADYVGMRSYNGPAMDRLEGFTRIAPLLAAWLHGGRPGRIDLGGREVDPLDLLREGVVNGTDPVSPEYWGPIRHWSQAIVEAADIALSLWLTRTLLWDTLAHEDRARIADWLRQVNHKRLPDNNWHLFVTQVNAVLAALGEEHDAEELGRHYQRAKSFYRGNGWFIDGDRPATTGFDFYNAWGFHYHLYWIRHIAPDLDSAFLDRALRDFVSGYRYLIGPAGFPIFGRSACYRMAVATPLVMAHSDHPDLVSPGLARRALDMTWQYFVQHGALWGGNVTQGYFAADPRLLENYSGPASCLWSLRSLIPALALPDDANFWLAQPAPLPVEERDYRIGLDPPGWTVQGDTATLTITLETGQSGAPPLEEPPLGDRIIELLACKPRRPDNVAAKYLRARYDSAAPYGIAATRTGERSGHPATPCKP